MKLLEKLIIFYVILRIIREKTILFIILFIRLFLFLVMIDLSFFKCVKGMFDEITTNRRRIKRNNNDYIVNRMQVIPLLQQSMDIGL